MALRLDTPTTACVVILTDPRFEDANSIENADFITMNMALKFNGITAELGDKVSFPRNATTTTKNAAIRARVNQLIAEFEPGVTLNNANIQIVGLPV